MNNRIFILLTLISFLLIIIFTGFCYHTYKIHSRIDRIEEILESPQRNHFQHLLPEKNYKEAYYRMLVMKTILTGSLFCVSLFSTVYFFMRKRISRKEAICKNRYLLFFIYLFLSILAYFTMFNMHRLIHFDLLDRSSGVFILSLFFLKSVFLVLSAIVFSKIQNKPTILKVFQVLWILIVSVEVLLTIGLGLFCLLWFLGGGVAHA